MPDADFPANSALLTGSALHQKAQDVSAILSALANHRRLRLLCHLLRVGEAAVSELAQNVGLSQSALSQHLSVLRAEGLVRSRRSGLNIFYSIADPRIETLVRSLEHIYCTPRIDDRG